MKCLRDPRHDHGLQGPCSAGQCLWPECARDGIQPKKNRPDAFMLAHSFRQAHSTATIDWGWDRCGEGDWRRPDGAVVRYVGDIDSLRSLRRGTVVFLGHRWFDRPRMELADIQALEARLKITDNPMEPIERAGGI